MAYGNDFFTGAIDEKGDILVVSATRDYKKVGIDLRREEELLQQITEMSETLDNWRGVLIENGLLKVPKTPEEIAQEQAAQQAQINQALLEAISELKSELGALKNGASGNGNAVSVQPVGQDRTGNRKAPGGSKGSDKPSGEDAAGNNE